MVSTIINKQYKISLCDSSYLFWQRSYKLLPSDFDLGLNNAICKYVNETFWISFLGL
jgi:hypothetical protein